MNERQNKQKASLDSTFPKGKFHVTHEKDAKWETGFRKHLKYRDLGMDGPTGGRVHAHIHINNGPCPGPSDLHYHDANFHMVYVLKGWGRMEFEGVGELILEEGSCMYQEPGLNHRLIEYSDDYKVMEITIPGEIDTVTVAD